MDTGALLGRLVPALGAVDTAQVLPTVTALLADAVGAEDVLVQLVDYRMMSLRELVSDPDGGGRLHRDQPVDGSPAGAVFREQRTVVEYRPDEHVVRTPISIRGQRLGVLTVVLPVPEPGAARPAADDVPAAVEAAAAALAIVIRITGEGSDVFEIARRSGRLSVAAEMQWQLLPGTGLVGSGFELAGHLEPAQRVGGDGFDWAQDAGQLWVTIAEATGAGDSAALTCTLAVTALRNARRAQLPLGEQAQLTSEAVWAQFRGERSVGALLLRFDQDTGGVAAVLAGSGRLLRCCHGRAGVVELTSQPALGLLDETEYVAEEIAVQPGDRLLLHTDGAEQAPDKTGAVFGTGRLIAFLERTRSVPPHEVVRSLVRELLAHVDDVELPDDASVICLDWHPSV